MPFDEAIPKNTTAYVCEVMLRDSSTGQGKTGVAFGDVTCRYMRQGAAANAAVTMALGVLGTYTDSGVAGSGGGWIQVDATNQRGVYQFSVPNAAIATGADAVRLNFQVSGAIDASVKVLLTEVSIRNAAQAAVCTEARLAELDGVNLPADVAGVQSDTNDIQDRLPAALVGGRMDSSVGAVATGAIAAAAFAADAISAAAMSTAAGEKIANALLDLANAVEANGTIRTLFRLAGAVLGGVTGGAGSNTETFDAMGNPGTTRVTTTLDGQGNRTSVTVS